MQNKFKFLISIIAVFFITLFSLPLRSVVLATQFDLIAPSGELTRGESYDFIINIDTQGESLTSIQIGMTYETEYLEYEGITPGNTFPVVSAQQLGGGKLLITGESQTPFSGAGVFAYVRFKLIATAPGESQLCVLWAPESPTDTPTPPPNATPTNTPPPGSTSTPVPPTPTALPKTGSTRTRKTFQYLGVALMVLSIPFIIIKKFS